jgi:F-type H+-transporting ATPase subunit epsilon
MAETMQFDLVSPERRLASLEAREVRIPGADGQLTAMPDHAPTITTLRPGIVAVTAADGTTQSFAVTGGFAEITQDGMSVLAERAYQASADSREAVEAQLAEARRKAEAATAEQRDAAELLVSDLVELMDDMV